MVDSDLSYIEHQPGDTDFFVIIENEDDNEVYDFVTIDKEESSGSVVIDMSDEDSSGLFIIDIELDSDSFVMIDDSSFVSNRIESDVLNDSINLEDSPENINL